MIAKFRKLKKNSSQRAWRKWIIKKSTRPNIYLYWATDLYASIFLLFLLFHSLYSVPCFIFICAFFFPSQLSLICNLFRKIQNILTCSGIDFDGFVHHPFMWKTTNEKQNRRNEIPTSYNNNVKKQKTKIKIASCNRNHNR